MTKSRNLAKFPKTSAIQVPSGDTAARPSAANGYFRYNTSTSSFEGYSNGNWGAVGGAMYVSANTVSDANNISTGFFGLPAGTTGQRPAYSANGYLRYNTTLSSFEGFSGGAWGSIGGSLSTNGLASWNVVSSNYTVGNNIQLLANSAAGTFTITLPASPVLANVVVIADGSGPNTGWSNNNVLVDPNGRTIQGIADTLALNISRSSVSLIYDGSTWQVISTTGPKGNDGAAGANGATGAAGVGANATQQTYRFNATNNQTIFVGADAYSQTLSYNVNAVSVYLNGVYLRPTEDYIANNGTTIYLNSGTLANDALDILSFNSMSLTAAQNTITTYVYTASNNQTSFGGTDINGRVLNYNTDNLFVTLNGLTLRNGVDYLQSNSSYLALTSGANANDEINIVAFGSFQLPGTANTISNYFYTATPGQTIFTGNDIYGSPLSYNGGNLIVTRNGSTLRNKIDYTALSGTSITLNNPAYANDEIGILTFTSFITSANTDYRYLSKISDDVYTGNITSIATGYFQVPQGTTAQRPAATSAGLIRYNTTLNSLESANGTAWSNVGSGSSSSGGGGGVTWTPTVQNTSFIAVKNNGYLVNTATGNVTVTLPASPTVGDNITFVDYGGNFSANALIFYPNGSKINANTINVALTTSTASIGLVYTDNNKGWIAYNGFQSSPIGNYNVEYLIVAGGGGGSSGYCSGAGGAGGMLTGVTPIASGTAYSISVGAGGTGVTGGSGWPNAKGTSGSNSSFASLTSIGGGGGAGNNSGNGLNGGSGGGGSSVNSGVGGSGTAGQGNPGGSNNSQSLSHGGGGGGGAGATGGTGTTSQGGDGGIGLTSSITGTSTYYAGGGGGGTYYYAPSGGNGPAGTGGLGGGGAGGRYSGAPATGTPGSTNLGGGGGGGAGFDTPTISYNGGNGGSGFVVVRYLGPQRASGGAISISGGYTIHTFTGSGTFIG